MAENKKSFILYINWLNTFEALNDNKAGRLIKHILRYVNDLNPVSEDKLIELLFIPIKDQLKRDLIKWEQFKLKQSENGKLGGRPKLENQSVKKPKKPSLFLKSQKSLNVNDNVNVNVLSKESSKGKKTSPVDISKSNLFREPNIPDIQTVQRIFNQAGGTDEMAQKFFDNNQATGWYARGSPITNFANLVPSFVENWKKNLLKISKNGTVTKQQSQASAIAKLIQTGKAEFAALGKKDPGNEI